MIKRLWCYLFGHITKGYEFVEVPSKESHLTMSGVGFNGHIEYKQRNFRYTTCPRCGEKL